MKLDFERIKEIKLVDVVARYKIPLRFKAEYAACCCPLPTHKTGDTSKSFSINLRENYFRCFSASCNEAAGCKGGDVINFVALMDATTQLAAAKKLAEWFGIPETAALATTKTKPPQHMDGGSNETEMQRTISQSDASAVAVKYMKEIEAWFYALVVRGDQEDDEAYWGRILKAVKTKLVESYRSGQRAKVA